MTSQPSEKPRTSLLILLVLVVGLFAFYKYGRSIWKPIHVRAMGRKTVKQIVHHFAPKLRKQMANWQQLTDGKMITLIALKKERQLELWKKIKGKQTYIKTYRLTAFSGKLGPKRKQGDLQIPEGIYRIVYLNPNSSYHLSMKVNYPNRFDKKMAKRDKRKRLGGDIFIHGNAVTIGCIPIGNEPIEELFTIIASNGYRRTKVLISPYDMRKKKRVLKIPGINWEHLLYRRIKRALLKYPRRNQQK